MRICVASLGTFIHAITTFTLFLNFLFLRTKISVSFFAFATLEGLTCTDGWMDGTVYGIG